MNGNDEVLTTKDIASEVIAWEIKARMCRAEEIAAGDGENLPFGDRSLDDIQRDYEWSLLARDAWMQRLLESVQEDDRNRWFSTTFIRAGEPVEAKWKLDSDDLFTFMEVHHNE